MVLKHPPWGEEPLFEWDEFNENHIWRHKVTVFEVEECFENPYKIRPHRKAKAKPKKYGDRYAVLGKTNSGRKLIMVVQHKEGSVVRIVTAWSV